MMLLSDLMSESTLWWTMGGWPCMSTGLRRQGSDSTTRNFSVNEDVRLELTIISFLLKYLFFMHDHTMSPNNKTHCMEGTELEHNS